MAIGIARLVRHFRGVRGDGIHPGLDPLTEGDMVKVTIIRNIAAISRLGRQAIRFDYPHENYTHFLWIDRDEPGITIERLDYDG